MNIKLIAIDLDETLLRSDKTYERDRFNEVVEDLINQGMIIAGYGGVKKPSRRTK